MKSALYRKIRTAVLHSKLIILFVPNLKYVQYRPKISFIVTTALREIAKVTNFFGFVTKLLLPLLNCDPVP